MLQVTQRSFVLTTGALNTQQVAPMRWNGSYWHPLLVRPVSLDSSRTEIPAMELKYKVAKHGQMVVLLLQSEQKLLTFRLSPDVAEAMGDELSIAAEEILTSPHLQFRLDN